MRIGVLGGTFDPIHVGHLRAAELAREALALHQILLVPASVPPHRTEAVSSPLDRYAMVCLASASHSGLVPSDIELRREGPSYTVDTLRALADASPQDEIVLVVGSDAYAELCSWRDVDEILARWPVAIVERPGSERRIDAPAGGRIHCVEGAGLAVSSSQIRRLAAAGKSIRYLVPELAAEYVIKRGLYR